MDARTPIRRRRSLEENEFALARGLRKRLLEKLLLLPASKHFLFEIVGRAVGRKPSKARPFLVSRSPRRRHGADGGHSRFGPVELEPAPRSVLATTCESDASTSESCRAISVRICAR